MAEPDDTVPEHQPIVPPATEVALAGVTVDGSPPPKPAAEVSEPHPAPPTAEVAPMLESAIELPQTRFRQLMARLPWSTGLRTASSLIWVYVVVGELVVNTDMPEDLAITCVLTVVLGTWVLGLAKLHRLRPEPGAGKLRLVGSAGIALGVWSAAILLATIVGAVLPLPIDGFITLLLLVLSLALRFRAAKCDPCKPLRLAMGWRVAAVFRSGFAIIITLFAVASVLEHFSRF